MTDGRPSEVTQVHSRLLKCSLEVEDCRSYWKNVDPETPGALRADKAFEAYWFGARSLARIKVLIVNFRHRFDSYPDALEVLRRWEHMDPNTRKLVCHWHLQLADPLYRMFTGEYLVRRLESARPEVTRDLVAGWVKQHAPERWRTNTVIHYASKLLSAAFSAGLVGSNRDPRPLTLPRVRDDALTYLLYLLRGVTFEGTLIDNPYLASVGLVHGVLTDRLRTLDALQFRRQADLVDIAWAHPDLATWANHNILAAASNHEGTP